MIEHAMIVVVGWMNIKGQICIAIANVQMAIFPTKLTTVSHVQAHNAAMVFSTQ
jgi:hypothetical protein